MNLIGVALAVPAKIAVKVAIFRLVLIGIFNLLLLFLL
jgi:hypothetical protein